MTTLEEQTENAYSIIIAYKDNDAGPLILERVGNGDYRFTYFDELRYYVRENSAEFGTPECAIKDMEDDGYEVKRFDTFKEFIQWLINDTDELDDVVIKHATVIQ